MRLLFCALGVALWIGSLSPEPPRACGANPLSEKLVQQALQAELDGQPALRQALVADAVETDPAYAPARWHSGQVQLAGGWMTVEEAAARHRGNSSLAEYRRLRNASDQTAQAHFQLARYCRSQGLADQARLHWTYVLALTPHNTEALRALGLRRYKNQFLTADQLEQAKAIEEAQKNLEKHWKPKCTQLRHELASTDSQTRKAALVALRSIQDPEAIPWLDSEFADADDEVQLAILDALGELQEPIATLALVRRAVMAESPAVREAAAYQLRQRPIYSYAPVLISCIAAPVEFSYYVNTLRDGVRAYYSLSFEGPEAEYLLSVLVRRSHTHYTRRTGTVRQFGDYRHFMPFATAALAQLSAATMKANEQAAHWNPRIFEALRIATELEKDPTPAAWWDWWYDYNELSSYEKKPFVISTATHVLHTFSASSCFMPGTIVWTETGPAPIESVQIGDRVLSQDLETGELAYKLVLNTTTRPPSQIRRVRTGDSEVHATLGHPFWVVGEGWRMTKQLAPGDRLHSLSGALVVDALEPGPVSTAHNLVVEDFNTYFVGQQKLLVHDNNLRVPTKALLPGLQGDVLR